MIVCFSIADGFDVLFQYDDGVQLSFKVLLKTGDRITCLLLSIMVASTAVPSLVCKQQSLKAFVRLTCLAAGLRDTSLEIANHLKIKVNYPLFLKKSKNNMF